MNIIPNLILAAFWLVIVPAASGSFFLRKQKNFSITESYLTGFLFLFALAEIMILLMMAMNLPLHILSICYGVILVIVSAAGIWSIRKQTSISAAADTSASRQPLISIKGTTLFFWAALLLILLQVIIVILYAHLDADDALYVGAATTAVQSDTIFRVNGYTGNLYNNMPRRYILSPFPIFLAVISQLSGGLHPAIMAHTVFPAILIPTAYVVMYVISKRWFPEDKNAQGIFLFLTVVLCWFSAYSVFNAGNFQMIRIWQGKAVLAAILLPFLFYLSISIVMEKEPQYSWLLYFMATLSACLLSSMGIILAPIMVGIFTILALVKFRSLKRTLFCILCCLPSAALGILYILIPILRRYGIL